MTENMSRGDPLGIGLRLVSRECNGQYFSSQANCLAIYADTGYASVAVTFPILIARSAKVWGTESTETTIPEGNLNFVAGTGHCSRVRSPPQPYRCCNNFSSASALRLCLFREFARS